VAAGSVVTGCHVIPNLRFGNVLCTVPSVMQITVLVSRQVNNSSQKDKTIKAPSPSPLSIREAVKDAVFGTNINKLAHTSLCAKRLLSRTNK